VHGRIEQGTQNQTAEKTTRIIASMPRIIIPVREIKATAVASSVVSIVVSIVVPATRAKVIGIGTTISAVAVAIIVLTRAISAIAAAVIAIISPLRLADYEGANN
jgi:hypothetical protein